MQRSTMLPSQPRVCWPINQREPVGWRKSEHVIPSFAKKNPFPNQTHYEHSCPCNTRTIKVSSSMTKIVSKICLRIILKSNFVTYALDISLLMSRTPVGELIVFQYVPERMKFEEGAEIR